LQATSTEDNDKIEQFTDLISSKTYIRIKLRYSGLLCPTRGTGSKIKVEGHEFRRKAPEQNLFTVPLQFSAVGHCTYHLWAQRCTVTVRYSASICHSDVSANLLLAITE